jgi:hypothetical protein
MQPAWWRDVPNRLEAELASFGDPERRDEFRTLLCTPVVERRCWDWNDDRPVEVYIFARSPGSPILFACANGGYDDPWGLITEGDLSLGMDAQWYLYLEDAFIDSGISKRPPPVGFEVR